MAENGSFPLETADGKRHVAYPQTWMIADGSKVLAAANTMQADVRDGLKNGKNSDAAAKVGKLVAERAIEKGVTDVVFDRGGHIFHGRIKAPADAAREAGLNF